MPQTDYAGLAVQTQLVGTMNLGDGVGVTFTLLNGTGYPTGALGVKFPVTIDPDTVSEEKVLCSSRAGNVFTIAQRGYDDTAAVQHNPGAVVRHSVDATVLRTNSAHVFDTTRDDHTQYAKADGSRKITLPGVQVGTAGVKNITSGAGLTIVTFDAENYDVGGMHAGSSGRLSAVANGKHLVHAFVRWPTNAAGYRRLQILANSSTIVAESVVPGIAGLPIGHVISCVLNMLSGDYVELYADQTSGSTLDVGVATSGASPTFALSFLAP